MDKDSKAALDLLVQNGYLEIVKEKYRPTKKLNEQKVSEKLIPEYLFVNGVQDVATWEDLYLKFIKECNVPKTGESGSGDLYELNRYTEDAMKHLRDLIKSGIKYDVLVKVTKAYYATGSRRFKKKIGNYITEGHWRMDYEVMKNQTETQQQQHINEQLNSAQPFTRDRIG